MCTSECVLRDWESTVRATSRWRLLSSQWQGAAPWSTTFHRLSGFEGLTNTVKSIWGATNTTLPRTSMSICVENTGDVAVAFICRHSQAVNAVCNKLSPCA